jgi:TctA family transporter
MGQTQLVLTGLNRTGVEVEVEVAERPVPQETAVVVYSGAAAVVVVLTPVPQAG